MVKHSLTLISGLSITWPTSYEAFVGRAELKPGIIPVYLDLSGSDRQHKVNGF